MEKTTKIFNKWFWVWLIVAVALTGLMIILKQKYFASIILATFALLPMRDWIIRFVIWLIDYITSINTKEKNKLNPKATYNRLIDSKKRLENPGFYRLLKFAIGIFSVIISLIWLIFDGTAFNAVFSFLYTIENICTGKVGVTRLLFFILVTLWFIYMLYWTMRQFKKDRCFNRSNNKFSWSKITCRMAFAFANIYGSIILIGIIMKFTGKMIWAAVLFWSIIIWIPIILFIIINLLASSKKIMEKINIIIHP